MLHGLTRMGGMIRSFVVLFIFALSGSAGLFADVAKLQIPASRGDQCVEPVEIMRRNHFEFIVHQRDLTVHQGIRTKRHSLAGCIDCHSTKTAAGQYLPVNAEGEFCQTCHTYAAVKIDCFSCHAAVPTEKISQSP